MTTIQKKKEVIKNPVRNTQKKYRKKLPKTAIVGLGYVGLPLALRAYEVGYPVIGFDLDQHLISELRNHRSPSFLDTESATLVKEHSMALSTDSSILKGCSVIVVCVPTPVLHNHQPDLRPLISACESIAPHLRKNTLVIIESTVNPGVCDEIVLPLLSRGSSLMPERDFFFAYCPERINPGDTVWNVRSIPRVLGATGPKSAKHAHAFYSRILEASIHPMGNVKEAEAVKITENSFRDINIAFVNELAMSFKKLNIDILNVLQGASTKPFAFIPHYPGCGVGGHCIPVDPYYLIAYAKRNGFTHRFLETARAINNAMPVYTVDLLEKGLQEKGRKLPGSYIALLGLSYKRNVPDMRESPALVIEQELHRRGAIVRSFDPLELKHSSVLTLEEALQDAEGVIIATDHDVFRALTPKQFEDSNVGVVIDGRNCLPKEKFKNTEIIYHGIGR